MKEERRVKLSSIAKAKWATNYRVARGELPPEQLSFLNSYQRKSFIKRYYRSVEKRNEAYKQYEKMVYKLAWYFNNKSPAAIAFDDLVAEGHVAFCKAWSKFDPAKASFTTYLYNVVKRYMQNYVRKFSRAEADKIELQEDQTQGRSYDNLYSSNGSLVAFKEQLPHDCRIVLDTIFFSPDNISQYNNTKYGHNSIWSSRITRYSITKYFSEEQGWTTTRVKKAITGIKESLHQYNMEEAI